MLAFWAEDSLLHSPEHHFQRGVFVPTRERPERVEELLRALSDGGHVVKTPPAANMESLLVVHDSDYLDFLRMAHGEWQAESGSAGGMAVAQWYAMRHMGVRPKGFHGQLGYYLSGTSVPIGDGTWRAIIASAGCAVAAADAVLGGVREVYALCRPPGHHAYSDLAGGFCYINNAAVAAERLRRGVPHVTVLDVDVHHGNGTQGIFYHRRDVQFVSIHADPNHAYPWYAGYSAEQGEGDGAGFTLNLPLRIKSGDREFLEALDAAKKAIIDYTPSALVLSLGLDPFKEDPSDLLAVTTAGFAEIGRSIGSLSLPTVIVQEGGYAVDSLRSNLNSFLNGFLSGRAS